MNGPPKDSKQNIAAAVAAAQAADSVVLVMGIDGSVEAEVSLHEPRPFAQGRNMHALRLLRVCLGPRSREHNSSW